MAKREEIEQAVSALLDATQPEWSDERRAHLATLEGFTQAQRDLHDSAEPPQFGTAAWSDERAKG